MLDDLRIQPPFGLALSLFFVSEIVPRSPLSSLLFFFGLLAPPISAVGKEADDDPILRLASHLVNRRVVPDPS
jgi:hypothetical protein